MTRFTPLHAHRQQSRSHFSGNDLQPVMLERLTDNDVNQLREPDGSFLLTRTMLRESVLRDLRWLLNTIHLQATDDLDDYPNVKNSVLNYGIGALAGQLMADLEWSDLENEIREVIIKFEPRIIAESLQVRCVSDILSDSQHNVLTLELAGELWCIPYPLEFIFRTEIDLECGYIVLRALGGD